MPACLVILATGDRYEVEGSPEAVEESLVAAARGSFLQLAWLTEAETGLSIGLNPAHIVALRVAEA